ncbi:conjugal transfer protein TraB [Caballeronia sp. LP006]|uniref:VirB4 family type IV secretion/conjugal transfer ATPase n=1 Tax=Caballeronia sp. LP006 TaxID=3038552 RepID=UPI002856099A|nr:conjugal transfer protein TraB [Caballeronia sp. LP006]MDR5826344.1 conjugal transfer protein TraB [Caballeronia sp. LP006]
MAVSMRRLQADAGYRKEPSAVKFLPYSYHVTDSIVSTVSNEYLMTFRIRGRSHECASDAEHINWRRDLNQLFKTVGNEHVRFWTHLHHHQTDRYPKADFDATFPRGLDCKYRQRFEDVPLMTNDWYLTVVYNPVGDLTQKFLARFERPTREDLLEIQAEAIASLEDIASQITGAMRAYGIEALGIYYRDARGNRIEDREATETDDAPDPDDILSASVDPSSAPASTLQLFASAERQLAFSSALEFFSFLANDEWQPVPITRDRARESMLYNRIVSSVFGDVMQSRRIDSDKYVAGVEIVDFPEATEPGQLNILMEADFEFVLSQQYCCMSSIAASVFLSNQEKAMLETKDKSRSQIAQMADAADDVVSRRVTMGWYYGCLHVTADTPKEAQRRARSARVMLNSCSVVAGSIGLASDAAWWSRLPANHALAPRPVPINSMNFLSFSPFHNFMVGKPDGNPWGPAVALLKTVTGTPLFFNWHSSPLNESSLGKRPPGHAIMLGKTGSGKTTLLSTLLSFSTKFRPRQFIYDVGQGMYPLVAALGGLYTVLRDGHPTGWQPAQLAPTEANIRLVKRLIRLCAETSLESTISHDAVKQVNEAVDAVMGSSSLMPPETRTFTAIVQHLPRPYQVGAGERPSLASLLEPWCRGGEHGWLFDNDADELDLSQRDVFGFDLADFIVGPGQKAPVARTPLLMYLLYRVRSSIDGTRRVVQTFDEFAQYLDDPTITLEVKRGLKTDRKKDCIYVFATQEANDALDSAIGKTITQACVTKVMLYNPEATPSDYLEYLKLTPAELDAMLSIPEDSRQFLVKQGNQSAVAVMDLSGMDDEIAVLSGTPDNAERLDHVIDRVGAHDPDAWLPGYFDAVRRKA